MAKFKCVPNNFIAKTMFTCWKNFVSNFSGWVRDDDFFAVLENFLEHEVAVELIRSAFSKEEIAKMTSHRYCNRGIDLSDSLPSICAAIWEDVSIRKKSKVLFMAMADYLIGDCGSDENDSIKKRFEELKNTLKLSDLELEVAVLSYIEDQTCFTWPTHAKRRERITFYAMALDRSYSEVLEVMKADGRLRKFGVIDREGEFSRQNFASFMDGTDNEAITRRFYEKKDVSSALPWAYFGSAFEKDCAVIRDILSSCEGKCNILFYGTPGSGKTSLAYTIANELGRTAFEIRQGDSDGSNMKSSSRMVGIRIANEQENAANGLLIVDEADELLRGASQGGLFGFSHSGTTEKGITNALLDGMRMPTIWISNAPAESMDESVRRRFDYSVRFDRMSDSQRVSVWRNLVAKFEMTDVIGEDRLKEYAAKYQTSAGGISIVLENVKRMAPKKERVDQLVATLMKPHCELMCISGVVKLNPAKGYSLDGLNVKGKIEPKKIVRAVRNYYDAAFSAASEDRPRMNILLFGPPGTGKTEFVKFLGKELGKRVLVVKGSDLLSCWVGETEQKIAEYFRRAEKEGSILFFDEIDGLVQDRAGASQRWEVSQVNELLQQMENFDGVMVAATNFNANLDAAIMRRFTFKLEFDYLDKDGRKIFFEKMFKSMLTREEESELSSLENLTPGDFRTVRQELFYLGDETNNTDRLAALREECLRKKDGKKITKIGF